MATTDNEMLYTYWTTSATSCTTTASSTIDDSWGTWCSDTTATSANVAWSSWTIAPAHKQHRRHHIQTAQVREVARRTREAELEKSRKYYEEMQRKRDAAEKKAQQLLMDLIGPEQLEVYKETGRLFVRGAEHDYILKKGGLVTQVGKDRTIDLCVHLADQYKYPETDNVIGLKLMLEGGDEGRVVKLANFRHYSKKLRKDIELPLAACM